MDANTEYFSSVSEESSSEDSSQNEVSEDEIIHISPTIRRRRIESDTEDELDLENEDEHNIDDNEWSNNITQTAASVIPFEKTRNAVQIEDNQPHSFYFAFLTEEILQIIVDETNRYAEQYMQNRRSTRLDKWTPTDKDEIKRFFGLLIWMGLVKLPKYESYWCTNNTYCQSFPRTVMSRNRFELLLRFLHFSNNQTANINDRLYKIRQLVDILNQNFSKYYDLDENICIDESLVPFRGRIKFRQFLKQKRHKYGIKVFKMCSDQGYTYQFQIYSGKNLNEQCVTPTSIVMNICHNILHRGHTIYTDNWYTSINLAEKLIDCNTHLVGTLRKDRKGIPVDVKFKKLKRGELIAMQNKKGIMVLKWKDKRDIFMLSTKHSAEMVEVRKKNYVCDKPVIVVDYNKGKCGVDVSDQMIAYSTPHRRTLKWYIKLALELLLNTSVSNTLILYKLATRTKIKVPDFRMALAMHLTQRHSPALSNTPTRRRLRHEMQKKEGQAYLERKFCRECYKKNVKLLGSKIAKNRTRKVTTYCPDCVDTPHLCLKCFNKVHR